MSKGGKDTEEGGTFQTGPEALLMFMNHLCGEQKLWHFGKHTGSFIVSKKRAAAGQDGRHVRVLTSAAAPDQAF